MPRFAANITMMFTELPFFARFAAAAKAGFTAVECLYPYDWPLAEVKAALAANTLQCVLINTPPGSFPGGERGCAAIPGAKAHFAADLAQAVTAARTLGVPRIHVMTGVTPVTPEAEAALIANLTRAAEHADLTFLLEPLNSRDVPGYFLTRIEQAAAIIARVDRPNVGLQFDFYHAQIMGGDLATRFAQHLPLVRHIQISGVPGRHEPDHGEINYPYLLALIDRLGYAGWIGCEYRPLAGTVAGLSWLTRI